MGKVVASASMSLDGYIAKHDNTIGRLFDWLQNGEVEEKTMYGSPAEATSRSNERDRFRGSTGRPPRLVKMQPVSCQSASAGTRCSPGLAY